MKHQPEDPPDEWLDAAAAAALLGIKRATLYAYVSRGRVRSRSLGAARERAYSRQDLERLRAGRDARAGHGAVAAGALRWGEPVLDSAITEITNLGPAYRGHHAVSLSAKTSFEVVAELLWTGELPSAPSWSMRIPSAPSGRLAALLPADARPIDAAMLAVGAQALRDPARFDPGDDVWLRVSRRIVVGIVTAYALLGPRQRLAEIASEASVAAALARAFGIRASRAKLSAINAALVLCADHELNASSFAGRVAASAGADPYACVSAAMATLSGPRHGGMSDQVAALATRIGSPGRATAVVREMLRRGETVPGFGHPLYPDGDPRAQPMLRAARAIAPRNRGMRTLDALIDTMELVGSGRPNLDVGLCALSFALRLPAGGGLAIFALGRSAGWLAHALEQRNAHHLLRPRARFVGAPA